ncbi:hypothetical protein TNCV_2859981 [Trichonephila clavipes]|nr:hypothetical protein TNCV_2859981 [Trichonephila clavipes]
MDGSRVGSSERRVLGGGGAIRGVQKCMDFFLFGHIKRLVYEILVPSVEDIILPISAAAERICNMSGILKNVRSSMQRRC